MRRLTVTFHPLAVHLAGAADSSSLFTGTLFGRLFKMTAQFHFAIYTLTLQLLLERAESLVDIVIANHDLHKFKNLNKNKGYCPAGERKKPY